MKTCMVRIAGFLLAWTLAGTGCATANEQAMAKMNGEQRSYLDRSVLGVKAGMSERQVTLVLGPPRKGEGTPRVCYDPPKTDPRGEVCVRFVLYKAVELAWTQPGESGFIYSLDLKNP
ncbi:MAG: hypothetical protein ABIJ09_18765 [Pseudomonadota bacterium]